jgi:RNA polymerase sigma-70 factor (ECF subfamily)
MTARERLLDELRPASFAAAEQGDLARLEALLAHDVELTGDGGGKAPALARSLRGRNRVARTLINWVRLGVRLPGVSWRPVEVNGGPGALFLDAQQRLIGVLALDIAGGQITSISAIVNPDKLTHLGPVADFRSLLRYEGRSPTVLALVSPRPGLITRHRAPARRTPGLRTDKFRPLA